MEVDVELSGHHQYKWVGTGWIIDEDVILTTRQIARIFTDPSTGDKTFRPGLSVTMDFYAEHESALELLAAVSEIMFMSFQDVL